MSKFANDLIASMKQAAAHAKGRKVRRMCLTTVEKSDVKAIRRLARGRRSSTSRAVKFRRVGGAHVL